MLQAWGTCTRNVKATCKRAGVPPCTANDLRRTFASWLKQAGVDSLAVAKLMGHASSRMVDLVYGQLTAATFQAAIGKMPAIAAGPTGCLPGAYQPSTSETPETLLTPAEATYNDSEMDGNDLKGAEDEENSGLRQ